MLLDFTIGSVCSGIGGAELAFQPYVKHAFMAEIEPFPRAVLTHHFPDVPLHDDFTTIQSGTYNPINCLVGGTPCQAFSIAGLRKGLADPRGGLALQFLLLAQRLKPKWIIWENVPGVLSSNGGRDFGSFLGALGELRYGYAYRVLNAQYFGVPQRRRRVFVVGCLGDTARAAAVLFEPESVRGYPAPSREKGQGFTHDLAPCIRARGNGYSKIGDMDGQDPVVAYRTNAAGDVFNQGDRAAALNTFTDPTAQFLVFGGNNTSGPIDVATAVNVHGGPCGRMDFESETFIAGAKFYSIMPQNSDKDYKARLVEVAQPIMATGQQHGNQGGDVTVAGIDARRLTPLECERLQGFPDNWTNVPYRGKPAVDGPRYKAIGNAFAVPVVRWIAKRILITHFLYGDVA